MKRNYIILLLCFVCKTSFAQSDGQLDSMFGINGVCLSNFQTGALNFSSMELDYQQNIIMASVNKAIKFNNHGLRDTTFGNHGIFEFNFGFENNICKSVLVQNNGRIILGGSSATTSPFGGGELQVSITRLLNNGIIDSTFGNNGKFEFNPFPDRCSGLTMALQSDGKIIVAGGYYSTTLGSAIYAMRITSDGALDLSFGNNGIFMYVYPPNTTNVITCCAIQPDDKILLGVYTSLGSPSNFVFGLIRLTSIGSFDPDFAGNGFVKTDIPMQPIDVPNALKIQADGKILLGGKTKNNNLMAIYRYNTNGTLDSSFAEHVIDTLNISLDDDIINDLIVLQDGKILLVGSTASNACVIRLNSNGTIDHTFNSDGIITFGNSMGEYFIKAILMTPTKLLAGGMIKDGNQYFQLGVAAYDFNLFSGIEDAGGMQEAASIYPNPSRNSIQFKQAPVSFNMSVCDLTGKLLAQKQMQASESYDVSTLQEGLYFIKLQTTEATQVIKFLKQ